MCLFLLLTDQCNMPVYRYERSCGKTYHISTQDEGWYTEGWVPLDATGKSGLEFIMMSDLHIEMNDAKTIYMYLNL